MVYAPKLAEGQWLNSKPLSEKNIIGKIVLYDFWTYSCVNCLRTLPYLKTWWQKYKKMGFLLIGIHTPEFDFEKDVNNVKKALEDLKVEWPIILDNNYTNWKNFANHYWPAKYLTNNKGQIVYEHFGEGGYEKTEEMIKYLILREKKQGEIKLPQTEKEKPVHACVIATPELYLGYDRGHLSYPQNYFPGKIHLYEEPQLIYKNSVALSGNFLTAREYVENTDNKDLILVNFQGTEANLVISSTKPVFLQIQLNGKVPQQKILGKDVNKNGQIKIDKPRMYNLLKSDFSIEGILSVKSDENKFRAYAFTFSGCV
jgi:thiol-disulfide isomerase/thioredoxin